MQPGTVFINDTMHAPWLIFLSPTRLEILSTLEPGTQYNTVPPFAFAWLRAGVEPSVPMNPLFLLNGSIKSNP